MEQAASKLAVWRVSANPEKELIDFAEHARFEEMMKVSLLEKAPAPLGALETVNTHWQDVVGLLLHWCAYFGSRSSRRGSGLTPESVLKPVINMASDYIYAEGILWKQKFYGYDFSVDGKVVTMRAREGDFREFLDHAVNHEKWTESAQTELMRRQTIEELLKEPLMALVEHAAALSHASEGVRRKAKDDIVVVAESEVTQIMLSVAEPKSMRFLRLDDMIGGNRVEDLLNTYAVIEALATAREVVAFTLAFLPTHTLNSTVSNLTDWIHYRFPGTSQSAARRCVAFLTFDRGRLHRFDPAQPHSDYALWPLVRSGSKVMLPHSLLLSIDVERILLRHAARNRRSSVNLTHRLDRPDLLQATLLASIEAPLMSACNVRMVGPRGDPRGDLDLVVLDPISMVGLIVEVAGGIRPASMHEYYAAQARVLDVKVEHQIPRLREWASRSDTRIKLPLDWPDVQRVEWNWAVAGSTYLGLPPERLGDLLELSNETVSMWAPLPSLRMLVDLQRSHLDLGVGMSLQTLVLAGFTFEVHGPYSVPDGSAPPAPDLPRSSSRLETSSTTLTLRARRMVEALARSLKRALRPSR